MKGERLWKFLFRKCWSQIVKRFFQNITYNDFHIHTWQKTWRVFHFFVFCLFVCLFTKNFITKHKKQFTFIAKTFTFVTIWFFLKKNRINDFVVHLKVISGPQIAQISLLQHEQNRLGLSQGKPKKNASKGTKGLWDSFNTAFCFSIVSVHKWN